MTQFAGYVLPGAVFVAYGLKWTLDASSTSRSNVEEFLNDIESSRQTAGVKKNNHKRPGKCGCSWRGLPVEGIIKLTVTAIGIAASIFAAYPGFGELQYVGDILYATVYLFFAISGLVDVLLFYCPHAIPFSLNHFALGMAFTIEGLMFHLHLRNQAFMEQHVHILLVCSIYFCAVVSLLEIVLPYSHLIKFARAFSSLIHGSWYIQSGFLLYNPSRISPTWTTSSDYNNALIWISLTFAWHVAGAFICLLAILLLSRRRRRKSSSSSSISGPPVPDHIEAFETDHPSPHSPTTLQQSNSHMHIQNCHFCSSHTLRSA